MEITSILKRNPQPPHSPGKIIRKAEAEQTADTGCGEGVTAGNMAGSVREKIEVAR